MELVKAYCRLHGDPVVWRVQRPYGHLPGKITSVAFDLEIPISARLLSTTFGAGGTELQDGSYMAASYTGQAELAIAFPNNEACNRFFMYMTSTPCVNIHFGDELLQKAYLVSYQVRLNGPDDPMTVEGSFIFESMRHLSNNG
ncbi:hypothetical protein GZH47_33595 (plasmid) [Paenibacillus rhizovicinus]|uniref:Uncharacterized protein n=1 Tax=Paenibacillus rhizovicinus TaxID=2704463 RepID=A0A6C0PBD3_9BACL|nr:hypothetical protein [Paenibacillus rhizovicinus]QHW35828.1 hypothetical protein GZH47_33595 [Paenibacillus rhizovicinus]